MNNLRTAWTAFKGTGLLTRLHVAVRVLTCPFTPLMKRFPATGALLDVGCGHGLLVHLLAGDPSHRHLKLHGVDHDSAKIAIARRAAGAGVEFSTANLSFFPESAFDAVSIIDVLYTVRQSAWNEILRGKDYGWCKTHGVHDCPLEHPDVAQLKKLPLVTDADRERAARALAALPRPDNNAVCKNYLRRIQFASPQQIAKAGVDIALVDRQPIVEAASANGEITYDRTRFASSILTASGHCLASSEECR